MRFGTLLTSVTLVALLRNHKAWASSLPEILKQCEAGLAADECEALFESSGYNTAITPKTPDIPDTLVDHIFYYQVPLYIDYRGYVLGLPPQFNGMVTYPMQSWRGDPSRGLGTRNVGPWNCQSLTSVQCCGLIERAVFDADINGEHLSCVLVEAYHQDPVSKQVVEVYYNPVDKSIHPLTNATELAFNEEKENMDRGELISVIDDTLGNKKCPMRTLSVIHSTFLHTMRGVPKARAYIKYTKEAIRRMRQAGVTELDVTADSDLTYWLPLMKDVVQAVSSSGGLHALTNTYEGYVVHQVGANAPDLSGSIVADKLTQTVAGLVTCITSNIDDLTSCSSLLNGNVAVTVHPKTVSETASSDYKGVVILSPPLYDGQIYYMFGKLGAPTLTLW